MSGQQAFCEAFRTFRAERGDKEADQALFAVAAIIRWLSDPGYGQLTLSAINHKFGPKLESRQIIPVLGHREEKSLH